MFRFPSPAGTREHRLLFQNAPSAPPERTDVMEGAPTIEAMVMPEDLQRATEKRSSQAESTVQKASERMGSAHALDNLTQATDRILEPEPLTQKENDAIVEKAQKLIPQGFDPKKASTVEKAKLLARLQGAGVDVSAGDAVLVSQVKEGGGVEYPNLKAYGLESPGWERSLNRLMGTFSYLSAIFREIMDRIKGITKPDELPTEVTTEINKIAPELQQLAREKMIATNPEERLPTLRLFQRLPEASRKVLEHQALTPEELKNVSSLLPQMTAEEFDVFLRLPYIPLSTADRTEGIRQLMKEKLGIDWVTLSTIEDKKGAIQKLLTQPATESPAAAPDAAAPSEAATPAAPSAAPVEVAPQPAAAPSPQPTATPAATTDTPPSAAPANAPEAKAEAAPQASEQGAKSLMDKVDRDLKDAMGKMPHNEKDRSTLLRTVFVESQDNGGFTIGVSMEQMQSTGMPAPVIKELFDTLLGLGYSPDSNTMQLSLSVAGGDELRTAAHALSKTINTIAFKRKLGL